jgi:hypothetical protein
LFLLGNVPNCIPTTSSEIPDQCHKCCEVFDFNDSEIESLPPVYPGLGASIPWLSLDQVIVQIRESRSSMTGGFCIFDYYRYLVSEVLELLGEGITHPTPSERKRSGCGPWVTKTRRSWE